MYSERDIGEAILVLTNAGIMAQPFKSEEWISGYSFAISQIKPVLDKLSFYKGSK